MNQSSAGMYLQSNESIKRRHLFTMDVLIGAGAGHVRSLDWRAGHHADWQPGAPRAF